MITNRSTLKFLATDAIICALFLISSACRGDVDFDSEVIGIIRECVAVAAGGPNGLWPLSALQGSTELYIVDNDNDHDVQKEPSYL